jgi:hypothetical protein
MRRVSRTGKRRALPPVSELKREAAILREIAGDDPKVNAASSNRGGSNDLLGRADEVIE